MRTQATIQGVCALVTIEYDADDLSYDLSAWRDAFDHAWIEEIEQLGAENLTLTIAVPKRYMPAPAPSDRAVIDAAADYARDQGLSLDLCGTTKVVVPCPDDAEEGQLVYLVYAGWPLDPDGRPIVT